MMNKTLMIGAVGGIAVAGAALFYSGADKPGQGKAFIDPSDRNLVSKGKAVYETHCASCHGANLQGQPEWRKRLPNGRLPAPPHDETGHTWHHPDAVLVDIVKYGLVPGKTAPEGYQSDMPAYDNVLPDSDIVAVLAYIKSRWPADALKAQKEVTLQAE
ncbi:cytochrome c [Oxalobacteraceae bacterium R-40]|uniref:Cytochrome c n=1 Tax=Keguizhuia sedimenti TaxID=3064264 RepID=A0ABU1BSY5_9BURK|nr:cytochrome c [Oxalobacteraceae bacterium R-40]